MRDWSLVSRDLACSGDVGGHRGAWSLPNLTSALVTSMEVWDLILRFMAYHGRIDE